MDPSYSVLLAGSLDTCGNGDRNGSVATAVYIGVFVTFGGIVLLLLAFYFFVYPRLRLRMQLRDADATARGVELEGKKGRGEKKGGEERKGRGEEKKGRGEEDGEGLVIERSADMEVNTVAGNFVVRL
jgi:hypothetical protein